MIYWVIIELIWSFGAIQIKQKTAGSYVWFKNRGNKGMLVATKRD